MRFSCAASIRKGELVAGQQNGVFSNIRNLSSPDAQKSYQCMHRNHLKPWPDPQLPSV
jgi:hypothetical protein